jgi:hypothetical protein
MGSMRTLIEARMNQREPIAGSLRVTWGEFEEWSSALGQRLTREIGGGARFLGGVGVARGVTDAAEAWMGLHTPGTHDKDEVLRQAATWLAANTKSTWQQAERYGVAALVATYDL